ncbi:hypothetical protein ALC57_03224 [Trachymyrmex cornetzi]|uniref:Uncharacterized protein n=1 Tax=Trachymyrmex cornetzi TaxID=471704 RepID=A0A151JMJ4_9HYME|nr:hypothetical protein ALC57_03224 [Trachymyrmex cornetzi]
MVQGVIAVGQRGRLKKKIQTSFFFLKFNKYVAEYALLFVCEGRMIQCHRIQQSPHRRNCTSATVPCREPVFFACVYLSRWKSTRPAPRRYLHGVPHHVGHCSPACRYPRYTYRDIVPQMARTCSAMCTLHRYVYN